MATCGPEAAGWHNARPHHVSEMRVSVVSLEEKTRKKLARQHFGCCDGFFLAHASAYSSWRTQKNPATEGVCLQEILQESQRISQERKNKSNRPTRKTDKENTEGIRREFGRQNSRKSPTRNNKKSRKNSGENTGEKTGVPWNAKFASTFSRVLIDSSPKDDDASPSV